MICNHMIYKYMFRNQNVENKLTVLGKNLYVQLKYHCTSYCGIQFWNSLDDNLKMCITVNMFKKSLNNRIYV